MDTVRDIHFKLLLQESADYTITEAIAKQSSWMTEIEESSTVFRSFLLSSISSSFIRQKSILNTILQQCLDTTFKKWKYLLWMMGLSIAAELDIDQRNELKELVKSRFSLS